MMSSLIAEEARPSKNRVIVVSEVGVVSNEAELCYGAQSTLKSRAWTKESF